MLDHKVYQYADKRNGNTYFLIKYKDPQSGKWKSKNSPVSCSSLAEADQWFVNNFAPKGTIQSPVITKKSIRAFFPIYQEEIKDHPNKINVLGHFTNHILKHPIADLDIETETGPLIVSDFITSIKLAPNTIRNILQSAREMIDLLQRKQLINHDKEKNPFRHHTIDQSKITGKAVETIAGEENKINLKKEQLHCLLSSDLPNERKVLYTVAVATGFRAAELEGLVFSDLNIKDAILTVDRQLRKSPDRKTGSLYKAPKKKSYRPIALHPLALQALKEWKSNGWKAYVGKSPEETDPIFPNSTGKHKYNDKRSILLRADLKKANLSENYRGVGGTSFPFTFHALRRTFATLLENQGAKYETICALMGNKRAGSTAKNYLELNAVLSRETIESLPLQEVILADNTSQDAAE